jgi:hypothetical protein
MRIFRIAGLLLAAVVAAASAATPATAQQIDITATQNRYKQLYTQGKYTAALAEARKLEAAVRARVGTQHANYAAALARRKRRGIAASRQCRLAARSCPSARPRS